MTSLNIEALEHCRRNLMDANALMDIKPKYLIVSPALRARALRLMFYRAPIRKGASPRKRKYAINWRMK